MMFTIIEAAYSFVVYLETVVRYTLSLLIASNANSNIFLIRTIGQDWVGRVKRYTTGAGVDGPRFIVRRANNKPFGYVISDCL